MSKEAHKRKYDCEVLFINLHNNIVTDVHAENDRTWLILKLISNTYLAYNIKKKTL